MEHCMDSPQEESSLGRFYTYHTTVRFKWSKLTNGILNTLALWRGGSLVGLSSRLPLLLYSLLEEPLPDNATLNGFFSGRVSLGRFYTYHTTVRLKWSILTIGILNPLALWRGGSLGGLSPRLPLLLYSLLEEPEEPLPDNATLYGSSSGTGSLGRFFISATRFTK